jgi:hypothetical protein
MHALGVRTIARFIVDGVREHGEHAFVEDAASLLMEPGPDLTFAQNSSGVRVS